jgi:hypothetical protein
MCQNGGTCSTSTGCPDGRSCTTTADGQNRPNIILFVSDDQSACHYGSAGSCRSVKTGADIRAPLTPNLDMLAAYGTVFPVAHNVSPWCAPSLNSIITGRYQRNFHTFDPANPPTIAKVARSLNDAVDIKDTRDPFGVNAIGGYCTLLSGKFWLTADHGFDAETTASRSLARVPCDKAITSGSPPVVNPPKCGADISSTYSPLGDLSEAQAKEVSKLRGVLEFISSMVFDRNPADQDLNVQRFFVWYAPRLPHTPLSAASDKSKNGLGDADEHPIVNYLFGNPSATTTTLPDGSNVYLRTGGVMATSLLEFAEAKNGSVYEMYGNVWWADDSLRAVWKFLKEMSRLHCVDAAYRPDFDDSHCTLAAKRKVVGLRDNTVVMHLSDNGFHLPNSKHHYTENGYRTRVIVMDPRESRSCSVAADCGAGGAADCVNGHCIPTGQYTTTTPPARVSTAHAHAVDILRTIQGYIAQPLTAPPYTPTQQSCSGCDGKDLRPYVHRPVSGGPDAPANADPSSLRHALCGHETKKGDSEERRRHLLTRGESVGRCLRSCSGADPCPTGTCVSGFCTIPSVTGSLPSCTATTQCAEGSLCLGGRCQPSPACIDVDGPGGSDDVCRSSFGFPSQWQCTKKGARWCRKKSQPGLNVECQACNANGTCSQSGYTCHDGWCTDPTADPPACPVCAPRALKLYVGGNAPPDPQNVAMTDLFLEPDETKGGILDKMKNPSVAHSMSQVTVTTSPSTTLVPAYPYESTLRMLNCCIDDWWTPAAPEPSFSTRCTSQCNTAEFGCD